MVCVLFYRNFGHNLWDIFKFCSSAGASEKQELRPAMRAMWCGGGEAGGGRIAEDEGKGQRRRGRVKKRHECCKKS